VLLAWHWSLGWIDLAHNPVPHWRSVPVYSQPSAMVSRRITQKPPKHVDSFANAYGSLLVATLFVAPAVPFSSVHATPGVGVILAVLAVGIICTGIAFLLYFRLIKDIGATSALTVTFLIPVFGILWGHLFLHEIITAGMLAGTAVVLIGTSLVTGFNPFALILRRVPDKI